MSRHEALESKDVLFEILRHWVHAQWIRPLDFALAQFLAEEAELHQNACPPSLLLAAVLVSHQVGRGHVCLDLAAALQDPDTVLSLPPEGETDGPLFTRPSQLLLGLGLDQWIGDLQQGWVLGSPESNTPLIRCEHLLYLRRYWRYEQQILSGIQARLANPACLDETLLQATLSNLFPKAKGHELDWQKIACALAARESFSVLTGGPGTGKTTTVVKLLATLQMQALHLTGERLRIRLAAPTGKAAARLNESLRRQSDQFEKWLGPEDGEKIAAAVMAEKVSTLHRLLGTLPDGNGFRHHRWNRLPVDVVVIDEASMVDVHLLACLFAALPDSARLILLGDKDQLASVEAGAVLGQLCSRAEDGHYWPKTAEWVARMTSCVIPPKFLSEDEASRDSNRTEAPSLFDHAAPVGQRLDQAVTMLRFSHRFSASSGIGKLAAAVNKGNSRDAWGCVEHASDDVHLLRVAHARDRELELLLTGGYAAYLQKANSVPEKDDPVSLDEWALDVLKLQANFQLLCTVRRGPWGVQSLNDLAITALRRERLIPLQGLWYPGRPVMVTRNDYGLRLMNGDIGITLPYQGNLRVAFPDSESPTGLRWVLPTRLSQVETVFAMTVHKSQGSEFKRVALLLPDQPSPVLTRELVYTGITRAAEDFTIVLKNSYVFREAVNRKIQRTSGPLTDIPVSVPANF